MAYQNNRDLRNLVKRVSDQEVAKHYGHPYEDTSFVGVVTAIPTGPEDDCLSTYLEVSPYLPVVEDDGYLDFDQGQHPLKGVIADERFDQVYVVNVPAYLVKLYYSVGDIVVYWHHSGEGADADNVRGSFVTEVRDPSFYAKVERTIEDVCCPPEEEDPEPEASSEDPGDVQGIPAENAKLFRYKFTAYRHNPTATSAASKFVEYICGEGEPFTGIAFNLAEVLNALSEASGTGINLDANGRRIDDGKYIRPVGPLICKVTPLIDPNKNRLDFKEFYFGPIPNEFGDEPERCKYCVTQFSAKLICGEEGPEWDLEHGTSGVALDETICGDAPEVVGDWIKVGHEEGVSTYHYWMVGDCCAADEDCTEPSPGDWPALPDPPENDCEKKCIHHLQVTYNCAADAEMDEDPWGEITEEEGSALCQVPDGTEGTWIEGNKEGTVITFDIYVVGGDCTSVGDCDPLSPEQHPQLPDPPKCSCDVPCPPDEGTYYLRAVNGVMEWVAPTTECPEEEV